MFFHQNIFVTLTLIFVLTKNTPHLRKPCSRKTNKWKTHTNIFFSSTKLNECGFRPLLCTYRLNWVRRTSGGWWDEWDDTALQTQDSKFERHNIESSRVSDEKTFCFFETLRPYVGSNPRSPAFQVCSINHCTSPPSSPQRKWYHELLKTFT